MKISTPTLEGPPIEKEVEIGGGVRFRLEGTRWLTEGTVVSIDENAETVRVQGPGFSAVLHKSAIRDATGCDHRQYQAIHDDQDKQFEQRAKELGDIDI